MSIKELLKDEKNYLNKKVKLEGWVKNHRRSSNNGFIDLYDGSFFKPIQIVYDNTINNFDGLDKARIGSGITIEGELIASPAKGQRVEVKASRINVLSICSEDYPLQKKGMSRELLRDLAYIRPRTNLFQAVFKIRSITAFAIHKYFQENDYNYVHSPLITGNDGEGAGEMFKVTTLDLENLPRDKEGKIDYSKDFFGKKVGLTVTGQLEGEAFALAFKKIYTFGPTFRAENSHTKTHASEFWMIEPEVMFADMYDIMKIEEECLKYVINYVLEKCSEEMDFLNQFVENGIIERLKKITTDNFAHVTHEEAVNLLLESKCKFDNLPKQGEDLATEHEKWLTEHFSSPVFVTDWPKNIKAFYMKLNDDNKTVRGVDLLVPGAGELMGGSERENDLEKLQKRMKELNIAEDGFEWYLNLRRFGSVYHGGFGIGFERLLIYLTGVENIRDVIPFPRTPDNCEF